MIALKAYKLSQLKWVRFAGEHISVLSRGKKLVKGNQSEFNLMVFILHTVDADHTEALDQEVPWVDTKGF